MMAIATVMHAAPDLLAACKAFVEPFAGMPDRTLEKYPDTPQARHILAARAAIAKAATSQT